MTKHVQCPHCGQAYALTEEQVPRFAGQDITCTQCGESFLVSHDLGMTGGLATAPSTFETRPEATAGAFPAAAALPQAFVPAAYTPPPYAPRVVGAYDASGFAIPPAPAPLPQPRVPYSRYGSHPMAVQESNGWAIASIICAVIGLIVPVVPGLLAIGFGVTAIRRLRERQAGAAMAMGGIIIGAMGFLAHGGLFYRYVMPNMPSISL